MVTFCPCVAQSDFQYHLLLFGMKGNPKINELAQQPMMKIALKDSVCSWPSPRAVPGSPPPSSTSPPMPGQLIHTASACLTRNSSSTTAKHPANTTLNLVSHMQPETQINIETQKYIQNARETCSRPETYCEYANTSVSGTEALPFSTYLTPSFSLAPYHIPLHQSLSICLFFPNFSFLKKIWYHLLKIRKNMVLQISLPGVTYDAASGSWETKCIKGDGCIQTFLQRLPEVDSLPVLSVLCSFLIKFQVCFVV